MRLRFWAPAQQHELAKHRFERATIVAPKVGDGLEVRLQSPQQPDDLDVAMTLPLQRPTRPNLVQIAVDVELQKTVRRVARPLVALASTRWSLEIKPINEGVEETYGIVGPDIVVNRLRKQKKLGEFESGNMRHARF